MSILLITPDRNDRAELLAHCKWQVSRYPTKHEHLIVNYPSVNKNPDLTDRIKSGYEAAIDGGFDFVVIQENDDFYPEDYLLRMWGHFDTSDFIGSEFTFYHNLRNRTWERSMHPNHSSLFCTAFRVEAMKDFKWNKAHKVFLDLDIWRYARNPKFRRTFIDTGAIGIKGHGYGLAGGKGHIQKFNNKDPDLEFLKKKVDAHSFDFYSNLKLV